MRSFQPPFVTRIVHRVTDVRWRVLVIAAVVVVAIGSGARLLTMNADYKVFFSSENPQLAAFDALQNTYTKDDNILVAIEPARQGLFTRDARRPRNARCPRAGACHMPLASTPIANFQGTRADGDDLYVEDPVEGAARLSDAEVAAVRATALAEPQLVNRLVSPRGDITALNITLNLPGERIGTVTQSCPRRVSLSIFNARA